MWKIILRRKYFENTIFHTLLNSQFANTCLRLCWWNEFRRNTNVFNIASGNNSTGYFTLYRKQSCNKYTSHLNLTDFCQWGVSCIQQYNFSRVNQRLQEEIIAENWIVTAIFERPRRNLAKNWQCLPQAYITQRLRTNEDE